MAQEIPNKLHTLAPAEAADWLGVDEGAVRALVQARYLGIVDGEIPMAEIRAFQARNAEAGSGPTFTASEAQFDELIDMLSQRTDELAREALELFLRVTPQAKSWGPAQHEAFLVQASSRLDAILAVVTHGSDLDEALQDDLREVGANAAWSGASLPHLLIVLRISRDLLLQTSMQIASDGQGRWDAILASFASEMMPAIDRLTDAIATGYWRAKIDQTEEDFDRLSFLIDNSPYGVYEADIDGLIQYANPALSAMVGRPGESLIDLPLSEVFQPVSGSVGQLLAEGASGVGQVQLVLTTSSGEQSVDVDTVVRRIDADAIGFGGIARYSTGSTRVDMSTLVPHIFELRRSVEILSEAGRFLTDRSEAMTAEQMQKAGESVELQAERLIRVIDELDEERKSLSN